MRKIIAVCLVVVAMTITCSIGEKEEAINPASVGCAVSPINKTAISYEDTSVLYEKEPQPLRYGFTQDEVYLLAQLLCGDSTYDGDGEYDFVWGAKYSEINYCEMGKVLCVVMNRVQSNKFPNTVTDVVMAKNQFSVMPKNATSVPDDIAIEKVQEWCDAYDRYDLGAQNIPESHLYFCAGPNLTNVTREHY